MAECLAETGVVVVGGDRRQLMVAEELANRAAWVRIYGLGREFVVSKVAVSDDLESAVAGVGVVIFPISGVNTQRKVRTMQPEGYFQLPEDFLRCLEPGTIILTGSSTAEWRRECEELNLISIDYAELDEVAIPNAIPTAEGAIQLAMEGLPVTLCQNAVLVMGFGRVAKALVRMLLGIGARVIVAARRISQLEEAALWGCQTVLLSDAITVLPSVWAVFNTIPELVLTAQLLSAVRPETMIIDLASAPGGTDFTAAQSLGINAVLAIGLPGKVAPRTAGEILASAIPNLLERVVTR